MSYIFESSGQDFPDAESAIAHVEKRGEGCVVKFWVHPNLPGRLPEFVYNSVAMWSYSEGEWWSRYIYDGVGGKLQEERPS